MSHNFHLFGFHHSDSNNNNDNQHHHHHHLFHFNRLAPEVEQSKLDLAIKKDNKSIHILPGGVERRNIFRILETIWAFQTSLVPDYQGDSNPDSWAAFDDDSQKKLEEAFKNKIACTLSNESSIGAGIIHFDDDHEEEEEEKGGDKRVFKYKMDINRLSTPLWRFEKKSPDETKQTECFEWKNQMRLEAFCDPNATLILTDKAFPKPFTAVLNQEQKKNGEKWQGFMYLNSSPTMNAASSYASATDEEDHYQDVGVQNMEDFPNFNMCGEVEKERLDEERFRKIYANQK